MIPDNVLSTYNQPSQLIGARASNAITDILDYEDGGVALNDASLGLDYQVWTGELIGDDIILSSPLTSPEVIYSGALITEFSFTFDQNMAPVISYLQNDIPKLRWYDSTISDYTITEFVGSFNSPKVFLDDKRLSQRTSSDVLLAYVIADRLYLRMQRDRYEIEYDLGHTCFKIQKIGMGDNWRVHFITSARDTYDFKLDIPCATFDPDDPFEADCDISLVPYKTADCATFDSDNPLELAGDETPYVDCEDCDMSADPYIGSSTCLYNTDECVTFDEDDPFEADCDIAGEQYPTDDC